MIPGRLDGKAILVTGAAAGIGRATAERLAAEGARLVLADRDSTGLRATVDILDGKAHLLAYDAADADGSKAMVDKAVARLGRLDAVCNIAGVFSQGHFTEIAADEWQRVLQINLTSVFHIMQRAIPPLKETCGSIVNTASIAGLNGMAYATAYAVSKAGILALSQSAAAELSAAGVRVNAIAPGGVRTSMGGSAALKDADPGLAGRRSKLPGFNGLGDPRDLAAAYAYLVSDDARYVSGSILTVDGAQRLI